MRRLLIAMICAGAMGLPAFAQTIDQRISAGLEAEGYRVVTMYRTWLGRIYVIAETDEVRREMVFNPATAEVLRDYTITKGPPASLANDRDSDGAQPGVAIAGSGDANGLATPGTRGNGTKGGMLGVTGAGDAEQDVLIVDPLVVPPSD